MTSPLPRGARFRLGEQTRDQGGGEVSERVLAGQSQEL